MKSSCCQAEVKITHGCDDDGGHGGNPCTCFRDNLAVTCWNECTKCGKPCDTLTFTTTISNALSEYAPYLTYTKGQMDAYAMENVETERTRIHSILSRLLVEKEEITQEVLSKVIFGNRK